MSRDLIVIGGGVNGLVAAAYFAKAGMKVLVLESRSSPGGPATTEELFPGFRFNAAGLDAGWLLPDITKHLRLASHGLELVTPDTSLFCPLPDGTALTIRTDPAKTAEELARVAPEDARRWPSFTTRLARFARFLERLYAVTPPQVPDPTGADLLTLLQAGRRLRGLGRREMFEFLRVAPMPIAEWLDEWFLHDGLKGAIAAGGIVRLLQGPRSAGTAFVLLHHHVGRPAGAVRAVHLVKGGLGNLSRALTAAASGFGAEIRTSAPVREVVVREGRVIGVALETGEHLAAKHVVSAVDPRRTLCGLVDAGHLDPEFLRTVRNIKFRGAVATLHLALSELPRFSARAQDGALHGAICIAPSLDYLERAYDDAKYGTISRRPYLEARIPTLSDPGLAPPGRHILSVQVQYAPYRLNGNGWDDAARERLADLVTDTLTEYAPNLKSAVLHRHVVTPLDLEQRYGLSEGHPYHGELTLDQIFFMRPVPGWADYRTPIAGLYLCGAGTHPGGGLAGAAGRNAARELLKEWA
jgi:phytoene dehydrogenase-like protein